MIIGIDCTAREGGLSIYDNRYLQLENLEDIPHKLKELGLEPKELEKILITIGPGSFTGLRVGLVIAKGIALPNNIPILGYSTFLAMIEGAPSGHLLPLLYARRKVVFVAHYKKNNLKTEKIFTNRVMRIDDLLTYLNSIDEKPIIFGNGAEMNKKIIEENGYSIHPSPPIAPLLLKLYQKATPHTFNPEVPFYLAPSEAYRKREKANVSLRPMEIEDIDDVIKIEKDVFPEPWDADAFYLLIIKKECMSIVGTLDDKVVSYMIGCPEREKFHLLNISVSREHWRKGYGSKMLQYLLKELEKSKTFKSCYLEHRINNKSAFEIYKSFGFRVAEINPGYYTNGEDAVIMEIGV